MTKQEALEYINRVILAIPATHPDFKTLQGNTVLAVEQIWDAAQVEQRDKDAKLAAMFSMDPEAKSVHPDIKWKDMNESAKAASHSTAQQISRLIVQSTTCEEEEARKKRAMDAAGQNFVEAILILARPKGITNELEGPFLLWIGNESWNGREPDDFISLIAKAPLLAKRFLEEQKK